MAQISEVLKKLLENTTQGRVVWKPTVTEEEYAASIGTNSVLIDRDNYGEVALTILDSSGRDIERVRARLGDELEVSSDLHALFDSARRIALNVDDQLDQLLRELETNA